jgi:hypothetical protein
LAKNQFGAIKSFSLSSRRRNHFGKAKQIPASPSPLARRKHFFWLPPETTQQQRAGKNFLAPGHREGFGIFSICLMISLGSGEYFSLCFPLRLLILRFFDDAEIAIGNLLSPEK